MSCEGRIKPGNERAYIIVDAINEAINSNKKISFQYFRYNVRKEKKSSEMASRTLLHRCTLFGTVIVIIWLVYIITSNDSVAFA